MAGYGYNTYNGIEPNVSDYEWNKSSSNHVCRPVIIDAEGRKQPIIRYMDTITTPTQTYVVKTTRVEHIESPVNHTKPYSSLPVVVRSALEEDPYKFNEYHHQQILPAHNRPEKVEEFITQIQTETAYKPTRTSSFSSEYWHPTNTKTSHDKYNNDNNVAHKSYYHRNNDISTTPLTKPTNDISAATEYLKEAMVTAQPILGIKKIETSTALTRPRFPLGVGVPRRSDYY